VNVGFAGWVFIRVMGLKPLLYCILYFFLFEHTLSVCVWR